MDDIYEALVMAVEQEKLKLTYEYVDQIITKNVNVVSDVVEPHIS
jgi:DNA replication protein DnaD